MVAQRLGDRVGIIRIVSFVVCQFPVFIAVLRIRIIGIGGKIFLSLVKVVFLIKRKQLFKVVTAFQPAQRLHGGH